MTVKMRRTGYRRTKWSDKEDRRLIAGYHSGELVTDIAHELNRPMGSVYQRAASLGIKKEVNASRFTCGHPANNLAEGTITIRGRGGKWIKKNGVWEPLQKFIWESANGMIPKGLVLTFIDGNTQNCELSNLKLFTKQEVMRNNNGFSLYPNELIQCARLISKIKKQL